LSLPLFAGTLFVSAFVLFLVQPIVGKMILPKLGGTPQVWNTCMVFFQTALLAGYAYTHTVSTRLRLKQQLIVHALLLFTALFVLFGTTMGPAAEASVDPLIEEQTSLALSIKMASSGPLEAELASLAQKQDALSRKVADAEEKIPGAQGSLARAREHMKAAVEALTLAASAESKKESASDLAVKSSELAEKAVEKLKEAEKERIKTHPMSMETWRPKVLGANPIPDALTLLAWLVGLPFLVIATSAPLLQKWFVHTGHPAAKDPYFLYGASNLGSMMALLLYPVAVEPWLKLGEQAWLFSLGYGVLLVLVLCCVGMVFTLAKSELSVKSPAEDPAPATEGAPAGPPPDAAAAGAPAAAAPAPAPAPVPAPEAARTTSAAIKKGAPKPFSKHGPRPPGSVSVQRDTGEVTPLRRLRWVCLAAVPSSFMLGVTSHITTDLSPVPLFWLVPLTLYLLSFILVYLRWPVVWTDQPHKYVVLVQPFILAFMIYVEIMGWISNPDRLWTLVFINVLAFFATALVCHGELAKDRPGTSHLTEYYLLMSVGGMVGGMFNGLIAPIFFYGLAEFPIALFLSCLVRSKVEDSSDWSDNAISGLLEQQPRQAAPVKGHKAAAHVHKPHDGPVSYSGLLDIVLPIGILILAFVASSTAKSLSADTYYFVSYGIPLVFCCLYYARPLRLALAVGAVLVVNSINVGSSDTSKFSDRSYFGIIRVKERSDVLVKDIPTFGDAKLQLTYRQLIHGHIDHGMNFLRPALSAEQKKALKDREYEYDFTRLATTYYHRYGPAGIVMEKFNWFPGVKGESQNTFYSDVRLPAAIAGLTVADLGSGNIPSGALAGMWSEPPFATIGLGTGTMASYARAFQHCHYYEIDNVIRKLSLPEDGSEPWFNYLGDAIKRKAEVQVLMGDARLRMAMPYKSYRLDPELGGGPDNFYHMMVVDAFSSDAIPAHLITKQAIQMYFTKLTEEGILCVHTSNRFVNLPKVVAAVASDLGYAYRKGRTDYERETTDNKRFTLATRETLGHFTSEWVMVARKQDYLEKLEEITRGMPTVSKGPYWSPRPKADPRYLWTDDHYNLITVLRAFEKPSADD